MTRKIYRATRSYVLTVMMQDKHGIMKSIRFGGADRYKEIKGVYETSDKEEQDMLEKNPMFGLEYVLEMEQIFNNPKQNTEEVSKEDHLELKKITFSTVKKCQAYFVTTLGIKASQFTSQQKCIEVGKEYGLDITFEK